jgi:hypothetical protein
MNTNDPLRFGRGILRQISRFDATADLVLAPEPALCQGPVADVVVEEFHTEDGKLLDLDDETEKRATRKSSTVPVCIVRILKGRWKKTKIISGCKLAGQERPW